MIDGRAARPQGWGLGSTIFAIFSLDEVLRDVKRVDTPANGSSVSVSFFSELLFVVNSQRMKGH